MAGEAGEWDWVLALGREEEEAWALRAGPPPGLRRNGHSTPWEMQLRQAGCRSSHCSVLAAIHRGAGEIGMAPTEHGLVERDRVGGRPGRRETGERTRAHFPGQPTLIFLALQVAQPVRLFLWARRPTVAYPGGCCIDGVGVGVGVVASRGAGVGGVAVVKPVDGVEAACSAGDSRSDMTEGSRDWPGVYNLPNARTGTGRFGGVVGGGGRTRLVFGLGAAGMPGACRLSSAVSRRGGGGQYRSASGTRGAVGLDRVGEGSVAASHWGVGVKARGAPRAVDGPMGPEVAGELGLEG